MSDIARWPAAGPSDGMYESFYLRAVSPDEPVSIWIRFTVQKASGRQPKASIWVTVFDESVGRPLARKTTSVPLEPAAGSDGWISIADSVIGPRHTDGSFGDASWSIDLTDADETLRHLPREWMYRSPIPKTKPESPVPFARFSGSFEYGGRSWKMDGWPGMLGHNWGSEHAWTWIWLHGTGFDGDPDAWIDVALGRVMVAGRLLPWVANGAVSAGGDRHRLGGLLRRGVRVEAGPGKARLHLPGKGGLSADVVLEAPKQSTVAWTYASPGGHRHDVLNCSVAKIEVDLAGNGGTRQLVAGHGGTYELGLPDRQDWVDLEPIDDEW